MKNIYLLTLLLFSLSGCALGLKSNSLPVVEKSEPVLLRFSPPTGYQDISDYKSRSITNTYINGQLIRKSTEGVDFSVQFKVTGREKNGEAVKYEMSTLEKDGRVDLSDFAMPEHGETIEYITTSRGEVLRAGDFSPGTIYYVPPVSLPNKPVRVGDTWDMKSLWISANSGVPLELELISILKNWRDCGAAGLCAEIEISGGVIIKGMMQTPLHSTLNKTESKIRFQSKIKGRLLLAVQSGVVLQSLTETSENMNDNNNRVQVTSCMLSYIREPKSYRLVDKKDAECHPQMF